MDCGVTHFEQCREIPFEWNQNANWGVAPAICGYQKYANWFYGWFCLRRFFVDLPHIYSDSEISDVKEGRTFTLWLFTCIFINRISALIDLSLLVVRWTHESICVRVCVCVCARVQRSIQMMATLQSLCRMRQIESEWNLCLPLSIKYTFSMFVRAETALTDCLIKIQFGWNRKTCLHQHNYNSGNGHTNMINSPVSSFGSWLPEKAFSKL